MPYINKTFRYILRKAKSPFRRARLWLKKRLGWLGIPTIEPYMGFSNGRDVYITGTVMEDKGLDKPHYGQRLTTNMLAMIKRYVSDEISGVRIKVTFRDQSDIVETNELGIFHCFFHFHEGVEAGPHLEQAGYELMDEVIDNQGTITARGDVLVVSGNPPFGVISDIDDTVMVTHSTQIFKKLRLMLFKNARTRVPFEGVAAFYRALYRGRSDQTAPNPVFYVSSSEWNLYDLLVDFFEFRNIPAGPLLLKELEHSVLHFWKSMGGNHEHKLEKIRFLFSFFNRLDFVLIGDSGQRDPELYLQIARQYPGRVKAVYIRCIGRAHKNRRTLEIAGEMDRLKIPMLLIDNTEDAARHALMNGFIDASSMPDIARQLEEDHNISFTDVFG
ncbi:MAG: phosphatase domain-containing protein [Marinilabilia sp.]